MGKLLGWVLVGGIAYVAVSDNDRIKAFFDDIARLVQGGFTCIAAERPQTPPVGPPGEIKPPQPPPPSVLDLVTLKAERDRAYREYRAAEKRGDRFAAKSWYEKYRRLDGSIRGARY